jgi:hypothetical protein
MSITNLSVNKNLQKKGQIFVHKDFYKTIESVRKNKLPFEEISSEKINIETDENLSSDNYNLEIVHNKLESINLNGINGEKMHKKYKIEAYDESIQKYSSLEGDAILCAFTLIDMGKDDYIPKVMVTLHFYTRSDKIADGNTVKKVDGDMISAMNTDFLNDRNQFLIENSLERSILFIDGPVLGGNASYHNVTLNTALIAKHVLPIFVVKNSRSNMIMENIDSLKGRYNSDLHWAYWFLGKSDNGYTVGRRTNFFHYTDKINNNFSKIFTYIKAIKDGSPQRIEVHLDTYNKYEQYIIESMDLVYYYFLASGMNSNRQIRPVAIAEKFARSVLEIYNLKNITSNMRIVPTMNQERGFYQ